MTEIEPMSDVESGLCSIQGRDYYFHHHYYYFQLF